jgi:hypothetical protein
VRLSHCPNCFKSSSCTAHPVISTTRNMQWNPTLHSSLSNKIILSCMWEMISATTNTYSSSNPLLSWSLSFTLSHSFWIKEGHKEERKNWNFMLGSCLLVLSGGHYVISVTKGNVVGWSFPARPGSSKKGRCHLELIQTDHQ